MTDLLAKNATNTDPGRVINISSVAGVAANAEASHLSGEGTGLWSCELKKLSVQQTLLIVAIDHTSKAAGRFKFAFNELFDSFSV